MRTHRDPSFSLRNEGFFMSTGGIAPALRGGAPTSHADPRATDRRNQSTTLDPRLVRFLEKLCSGQFFGKVVVGIQNGKVTDVRIEQTRRLDEL